MGLTPDNHNCRYPESKVTGLLQERLKAKNQTLNEIQDLMERWEQRITLRNLRIADRFRQFEIGIALNFLVEDTGEVWVALLNEKCVEKVQSSDPFGSKNGVSIDRKESPVLVDVIELMKTPQRFISTSIRLERIDSFDSFRAHSLYFSSLVPFVSGSILRNRKFDLPTRWFATCANNDQLVCEVVKCGSEIVDNVSGCCDGVEGQLSHIRLILNQLTRLRIRISEDYVKVIVPANGKFRLQIYELLLGPLNLYADQNQPVVGGERHADGIISGQRSPVR